MWRDCWGEVSIKSAIADGPIMFALKYLRVFIASNYSLSCGTVPPIRCPWNVTRNPLNRNIENSQFIANKNSAFGGAFSSWISIFQLNSILLPFEELQKSLSTVRVTQNFGESGPIREALASPMETLIIFFVQYHAQWHGLKRFAGFWP